MRQAAIALAILVLISGIYVGLRAGDTATSGPRLFAPDFAETPGMIAGSASMNGEIVRVELRDSEGNVIAEDDIMDGDINMFEFPLDNEELHGQDLTIVAIAANGTSTSHIVHIN